MRARSNRSIKNALAKDQLFLLRPGFYNVGLGPLYCDESVPVEGMLSFFPQIRELIDVHYIEFTRPRRVLVQLLGEEHQALPVLILAEGRQLEDTAPEPQRARGRRFFTHEREIRRYLSAQYGLPEAG